MKKLFLFLIAVISLLACDACSSGTGATSTTHGVGTSAATHFSITAQASSTVGQTFNFTVTAFDASNNVATAYTGTVQVTSSDFQAVLSPPSSKLLNGTGAFSATMNTAGGQIITATDSVASSITGTSPSIDVSAAPVDHFSVTAPAGATAGSAFNFKVTALDGANNPLPNYSGTVSFYSSDSQASLPANSMLTNGTGSFSATLKIAGNQIVGATDTVKSSMTGSSSGITVSAATASHFSVTSPAYVTSGRAFEFTVTAFDSWNNVAAGYSGVAHFTSSDPLAVLPADAAVANGSGTFSLTMNTDGVQTISATDTVTSMTGTSASINVLAPGQLAITSGQPPDGAVGATYGKSNDVCGDTPPTPASIEGFELEAQGYLSWIDLKWSGSSLPPGLYVTPVSVALSPQCIGTFWFLDGTPTTAGTFTFSLTATAAGGSGTASYIITIAASQASAPNKQDRPPVGARQSGAESKGNAEKGNR